MNKKLQEELQQPLEAIRQRCLERESFYQSEIHHYVRQGDIKASQLYLEKFKKAKEVNVIIEALVQSLGEMFNPTLAQKQAVQEVQPKKENPPEVEVLEAPVAKTEPPEPPPQIDLLPPTENQSDLGNSEKKTMEALEALAKKLREAKPEANEFMTPYRALLYMAHYAHHKDGRTTTADAIDSILSLASRHLRQDDNTRFKRVSGREIPLCEANIRAARTQLASVGILTPRSQTWSLTEEGKKVLDRIGVGRMLVLMGLQ